MKNKDEENPKYGCIYLLAIWIPVAIIAITLDENFNIDIGSFGIWILFILIGSIVGFILYIISKKKSK